MLIGPPGSALGAGGVPCAEVKLIVVKAKTATSVTVTARTHMARPALRRKNDLRSLNIRGNLRSSDRYQPATLRWSKGRGGAHSATAKRQRLSSTIRTPQYPARCWIILLGSYRSA